MRWLHRVTYKQGVNSNDSISSDQRSKRKLSSMDVAESVVGFVHPALLRNWHFFRNRAARSQVRAGLPISQMRFRDLLQTTKKHMKQNKGLRRAILDLTGHTLSCPRRHFLF